MTNAGGANGTLAAAEAMRCNARMAFDASGSGQRIKAMPGEEEYLLYPLDTGEDPACLRCGTIMKLRKVYL